MVDCRTYTTAARARWSGVILVLIHASLGRGCHSDVHPNAANRRSAKASTSPCRVRCQRWLVGDAAARGRAAPDPDTVCSAPPFSFGCEGRDCAPRFRSPVEQVENEGKLVEPLDADLRRPQRHAGAVALIEHPIWQLAAEVRPFIRIDARQLLAAPKRRYPEGSPEQRMPPVGDRRESKTVKTVCRMSLAGAT